MSRRTNSGKDPERTTSYGTAARTRPLSIQDIMLQREKKAASEAKKTKGGPQDNDNGKSNHLEPEKGYKRRKDLRDMPMENIRDTPRENSKNDDRRHTPKEGPKKESTKHTTKEVSKKVNLKDKPNNSSTMDDMKDTSKLPRKDDQRDPPKKGSKKERPSIRDDGHLVGKDKGTHSSHKHSAIMVGRADESKDGNHAEIRARNGEAKRSEYVKGPEKRRNDGTVNNDRIKERNEKPQNEMKRKDRSFDNEKSSVVDRLVLKKHDSSRSQDFKHVDRSDGRKHYAKPYHEQPRSKRRRSRSRDHDYDRERRGRSISLSPREQGYSYHGHDHDNHPPYYSMDRSRRKYAESDRHRTSGNDGYSGGSYRKYGSRLGGYSPRKRKTASKDEQTATKTASLVFQSPEKKPVMWDQPPAAETPGQIVSSLPVSFTASKQKHATTSETILAEKGLSVDSVQLTQATRPLRRLYIENVPSSATEDTLIGCLNDFLLSSGVKNIQRSKQPCLSCTINKEKCQAFVEFLTPEDATKALSFDGRSFDGSALKIRRPKEYVEMPDVAPKKPSEEIKLISDVVADSPHKIFVAGISGVISSEMLMEIVGAFGQLAAYRFIFNEDLGERCAFLEYIDHSITSKACAGLNGMKLGGRILTAVQVFPDPPEEVGNEASPFYGIPDSAKSLLEEPTKVLQLKNVFDREEYLLLSKSEVVEILEDVRLECARFGAVKSVNIVEYPASDDDTIEDTIVEQKDGSVKIEPTEHGAIDNYTMEIGTECSVSNQSRDVPDHSDSIETKDADSTSDGQGCKELDTSQCNVPAAADQHTTDLDGVHALAAVPTLDHAEADHMDSVKADRHVTTVDGGTVEKGNTNPKTSEFCRSTTPGNVVEKSERENEQQAANDVSVSSTEKLPIVDTRDDAVVSDTNVLEAGSICVEFMRQEAACMAAHSLHGRRFGNRIVFAGFVRRDLYLQRYPR